MLDAYFIPQCTFWKTLLSLVVNFTGVVIKGIDEHGVNHDNRIGEQQASGPMAHGLCSLCNINYATSYHHTIPKAVVRQHIVQMVIKRQEVKQTLIPLCRPCHMFIHKAFTHKQLAMLYNTLDNLKAHPLVEQFVQFIENRTVGKRVRGRHLLIEGGMVSIRSPASHSRFNRILRQAIKKEERQNLFENRYALIEVDKFFRQRNWQRSGT